MKRPPSRTRKAGRQSAQSKRISRRLPQNSEVTSQRISAEFRKVPKTPTTLLTASEKRGRKPKINADHVLLAADRLRALFESHAERINWDQFVAARSEEDLKAALDVTNWDELTKELRIIDRQAQIRILRDLTERLAATAELETILRPCFGLILEILPDPKFPITDRKAQFRFLADSLAGDGVISPRRSRDICAQQRKRREPEGEIIRREFYVECTCGYKGPALNGGCQECGTRQLSDKARVLRSVQY